ncbi:hypothetical protein Clacol_007467 [Clathrus columnatus]|uniref:Uncharacterized protein n=1 Tax=Clathrus columnatus TaxID=1419009 RepID=A0AAV5AEZ7_9AGAM|nr:hypothetical protein Clacol_007467 [Clathrus columnatus]
MPLLLSPAPSPTPSPAILEFLAQLSPPPPSPNSPPTPAFLCPACDKPNLSSARRRRQLSTSTPPTTAVTPVVPPHRQHSHQRHRSKTSNNYYYSLVSAVPPKFEQSSDGYWYLATSWSFHGKTSQPNLLSTPTSTPTPALPSAPSNVEISTQTADLDDDHNATSTIPYDSVESSINDVTSDYDAIKDSLPTGWTIPPQRTKFYSIPVIVVVSLILAILLSLVIAGCVLGHKAKSGLHSEGRQSLKKILNEAKARANAQKSVSRTTSRSTEVSVDTEGGDPELEILSDSERVEKILKQVKRKERLWDKWRNKNGKLSDLGLRRRKKKPTIPPIPPVLTVNQVAVSIPEVPENDSLAIPVFSPSSNTSSSNLPGRSGSPANLMQSSPLPTSSLPKASHTSLTPGSPQLALSTSLSIPSSTLGSTSQWHLPAYRHGVIPNISNQTDANEPLKGTPLLEQIQRFDQVSQTQQILDDCPRPDYPPPVLLQYRGHVATDDKATLEMRRQGISEPQQGVDDASTSLAAGIPPLLFDSNSRPSVPVWVDESLEDFQRDSMYDVSDQDNDVKTPSSSKGQLHLPPPPSIDLHRHLERHYYNTPLQSGDFSGRSSPSLQPSLSYQSQPSTSNFDLSSSSLHLQPSAPALEDTEEFDLHSLRQPRPSAPPLLLDEDEDEDEANSLDNETDDRDERPSRWDRETDLEASSVRTQSTPGITVVSARNSGPPYSRSRRRRSLSTSSTTTFSAVIDPSTVSKRLSLPRYEP